MYSLYVFQLWTNHGSSLEKFKTVSEQLNVHHDKTIIKESAFYNIWKCPMQIKITFMHFMISWNYYFIIFFFNFKTKFIFYIYTHFSCCKCMYIFLNWNTLITAYIICLSYCLHHLLRISKIMKFTKPDTSVML